MRALIAVVLLCLTILPSYAVNPDEVLSDPALEARARGISGKLRCLVCQNQSIDDSDATFAKDMRILVRERLSVGDSDQAAIDYIVARYGEYVLLRPRFGWHTLLLWASPFALLILGAGALFMRHRKRPQSPVTALSAEEEAALDELLGKERQNA